MTEEEAAGLSRRAFLKRMAVVGFAVPIVTSFALDGVASADDHHHHHGNQGHGNQGFGNQGFGNQGFGNQGFGNQGFGNQSLANQATEVLDDILGQLFPNQNLL
jgi:hypothetical protein